MTNATECSIPGCSGHLKGHGWCSKHWQKWRKYGDPLGGRSKRRNGEWLALLHQAAGATTDECVIFDGHTVRPMAHLDGVFMNASRAVWVIAHGDPAPLFVLHTCNQGRQGCVNIRHLYLGTQAQNVMDMVASEIRKGPAWDSAAEIRARYTAGGISQLALAAEYGVSQQTISNVIRMT